MDSLLLWLGLIFFVVRVVLTLTNNPDPVDFVAAGLACWIASVIW